MEKDVKYGKIRMRVKEIGIVRRKDCKGGVFVISSLYLFCFIFALMEVIFFFLVSKKPNLYFVMSYICTILATYGFWACSIARTYSEAALGCRILYMGANWVAFFILLSMADVCKINLPKFILLLLFGANMIVMVSSLNIGIGQSFYKSLGIYRSSLGNSG